MGEFFGDLSPFELLTAVVAFGTGAYTFYKSVLERPRLLAFSADTIRLNTTQYKTVNSVELALNLVNPTARLATLHRLELLILSPGGRSYRYVWNQVYDQGFATSLQGAKRTAEIPYPIAVSARNSVVLNVELKVEVNDSNSTEQEWPIGEYTFQVSGWVNKKNRASRPNLSVTFHVDLDKRTHRGFFFIPSGGAYHQFLQVVEWQRTTGK